jgi:hypothetical protein
MMNRTIILDAPHKITAAIRLLEELPPGPVHELIVRPHDPTVDRSTAQNALAFAWYKDIAGQVGDSPSGIRSYCKLHLGVAILKEGTSKICRQFAEQYDTIIRPLPYEKKLELMLPPIELPITSLMNSKQFTAYLDAIHVHFTAQGVALQSNDDLYLQAMGVKPK